MVGLSGGMGIDNAGSSHQGEFVPEASFLNCSTMRFVGDKDERGKALSANVERGAGIF